MRPYIVPILALAITLASCAGQVRVSAGAAGPALPAGSGMMLIGAAQSGNKLALKARKEVIAALARHGHSISADASARLEIGLTDRLASTGVAVIDGQALSPAKHRKFLQSCKDRTHRLVITYYGGSADVPVTRAWAEEYHCKGTIDASIAPLAERAVAALVTGSSSEVSKRRAVE